MRIGELAAATGCHFETIRYYERVGLLPKPLRTESGYRSYRSDDIARVRFIGRGRALGFTLEEIRNLQQLSESVDTTCAEVDERVRCHLQGVRRKLLELQEMEAELMAMLSGCAGGDRSSCHVLRSFAGGGPESLSR